MDLLAYHKMAFSLKAKHIFHNLEKVSCLAVTHVLNIYKPHSI